jgi:hypothetical protein
MIMLQIVKCIYFEESGFDLWLTFLLARKNPMFRKLCIFITRDVAIARESFAL